MFSQISQYLERFIRWLVVAITNYLPVKVIRDENGVPFLYRYHLFALSDNGPGLCIHHFVKSDPQRGFHGHPWNKATSFILCGGYSERILNPDSLERCAVSNSVSLETEEYTTYERKRWTFNYLNGNKVFHRVMLGEGEDVWTLFWFQKRSKTWGMVGLDGKFKQMSISIEDQDGGWWNYVMKGLGVHSHLEHSGKVIATVDTIVIAENKVLLIKRGKEPYKDCWALPGGRIEQKDQDMITAAHRELEEETQLKDIELQYVKTVGNNTRDPRGFCLTNIFVAKLSRIPNNVRAGDDAVDYMWIDLNNINNLDIAFDHKQIITEIMSSEKIE